MNTIHGLWPQWAESCGGEPFDVNQLAPILDEMTTDWPSCEGSDTSEEFWQHEWEKHGTCTQIPQLQYFRTALQLYTYEPSQCPEICARTQLVFFFLFLSVCLSLSVSVCLSRSVCLSLHVSCLAGFYLSLPLTLVVHMHKHTHSHTHSLTLSFSHAHSHSHSLTLSLSLHFLYLGIYFPVTLLAVVHWTTASTPASTRSRALRCTWGPPASCGWASFRISTTTVEALSWPRIFE